MLATAKDDIRSVLQSRRQQRTADLYDLCRAIARDESVDPDELLRATEIGGVDDEYVFEIVDMIRDRIRFRATAATKSAADQELRAIDSSIEAADELLEIARQKHARTVEPLAVQRAEAAARVAEADAAASWLLSPRHLPKPLADKLEAARSALHPKSETVTSLEREIREQSKRSEDGAEELRSRGVDPDEAEAAWRDENRRRNLSSELENLVLHYVRGRIRAKEAREKLPAAKAAFDESRSALAAVEREVRDF